MDKRKIGYAVLTGILFCGYCIGGQCFADELEKSPDLFSPADVIAGANYPQLFEEKNFCPGKFDSYDNKVENTTGNSSGLINIAYGHFNSSIYDISQSARTEKFYYSAKINISDVGGERPNSQFIVYKPSFKLGVPLSSNDEIVFKTHYFDKDMGLPGKINAAAYDLKRKNSDFGFSGQFNHNWDEGVISFEPYGGVSTVRESNNYQDFKNKMVGGRMSLEANETVFKFDIYQNRLINYYEQVILDMQMRLEPLNFNDRWQFIIGANVFAQERFGQRPAPFFEIIFKETDQCSHRIKITRDFIPLVFSQTYLEENYVEVTPVELRPRRQLGISYEIDKYCSPEWRTNINLYLRQDKDMWFWFDEDNDGLYSPVIIEKGNFAGVILSAEYSWTESFSQFFSLNIRKIRSKDSNYEFAPFEPKQKFSAGISYKAKQRFKMDIIGDYFGRRFYLGNSKESLKGYFLLGTKLTYELKEYLTLFVLVDNLLNDRYEIVKGYPNQSRSILAGMMVNF